MAHLPRVRVLRPALWCAASVTTIYVGSAALELRRDAAFVRREHERYGRSPPNAVAFSQLTGARNVVAYNNGHGVAPPLPSAPLREQFAALSEPTRLMAGLVTANVGVFGLERLLPSLSVLFSHVPASGSSVSLLTSAFGHTGLVHLGLNMYGLVQFLPPVAHSPTFASSGSHMAAFYLSAGILASYGHHLTTVWPRRMDRLVPVRGASGAIMAVVGAYGTAYPEHRLGIVLIPGSLPASDLLWLLAAFETYGLFRGIRWLPVAHAAHLSGLALGAAYVYFDAQRNVWRPLREWTFTQMRRLSLI